MLIDYNLTILFIYKEGKFKTFYRQLHWALAEYDRIVMEVIPVTAMIVGFFVL